MRIQFAGPARYRIQSMQAVTEALVRASLRRILNGPQHTSRGWMADLCTEVLKRQLTTAFRMRDIKEARHYLDAITFGGAALARTTVTPVAQEDFVGCWYIPAHHRAVHTVLYLHGGGYSFYPRAYAAFVARFAHAAKCRVFALDYRLSPEHKFPAQLEDALHAYRWLQPQGGSLVLAGDSAGANLALALLLTARDSKLRLPCLTILLSPATDFRAGLPEQETDDWIDAAMLSRWADWFCRPEQRCQPLVSPACAELQGLPPMYIQAGGSELLYPRIATFVERATAHGVDITLDTWPEMNHDFQLFGPGVPQAAEALQRIGEAIDCRLPDCKPASLVSPAWCG